MARKVIDKLFEAEEESSTEKKDPVISLEDWKNVISPSGPHSNSSGSLSGKNGYYVL